MQYCIRGPRSKMQTMPFGYPAFCNQHYLSQTYMPYQSPPPYPSYHQNAPFPAFPHSPNNQYRYSPPRSQYPGRQAEIQYQGRQMEPQFKGRQYQAQYPGRHTEQQYSGRHAQVQYQGRQAEQFSNRIQFPGRQKQPHYPSRQMQPHYPSRKMQPIYSKSPIRGRTDRQLMPEYLNSSFQEYPLSNTFDHSFLNRELKNQPKGYKFDRFEDSRERRHSGALEPTARGHQVKRGLRKDLMQTEFHQSRLNARRQKQSSIHDLKIRDYADESPQREKRQARQVPNRD